MRDCARRDTLIPAPVLPVDPPAQHEVPITIDMLHLLFSAFGFVHKIATFEKTAGFQALIQYDDVGTAQHVREQLDGRHVPRHLLGEHVPPPLLRISFSQHNDLNVKFQSHRSRCGSFANPSPTS